MIFIDYNYQDIFNLLDLENLDWKNFDWENSKLKFLKRIYNKNISIILEKGNSEENKNSISYNTENKNFEEPININIYLNWCKTIEDFEQIKNTMIFQNSIKTEKNLISFLENIKFSYKKILILKKIADFLSDKNISFNTLKIITKNNSLSELEKKLEIILEYKNEIKLEWQALWLALQVWTSEELEKKLKILYIEEIKLLKEIE